MDYIDSEARPGLLYVGDLSAGSTSLQRFRAFQELGYHVIGVDSTPHRLGLHHRIVERAISRAFRAGWDVARLPDPTGVNAQLLAHVVSSKVELLWIDKGLRVQAETIAYARRMQPQMKVVGFSLDNMIERHNQSRQFVEGLKHYDAFVTTKSFAVGELRQMGCPKVVFVDNSFDVHTHRPPDAAPSRPGTPVVGFIGTWEREREASIRFLAEHGIPVVVYGNNWPKRRLGAPKIDLRPAVYGSQYVAAIHAIDINLCFLRKKNRDLQTTRSVEIPACGAFMLAERSDEHLRLFQEGVEADYFSSDDELLSKTRKYLDAPELRRHIADRGRTRCVTSGYSYHQRLRSVLDTLTR